jgi:hypothetical protein
MGAHLIGSALFGDQFGPICRGCVSSTMRVVWACAEVLARRQVTRTAKASAVVCVHGDLSISRVVMVRPRPEHVTGQPLPYRVSTQRGAG